MQTLERQDGREPVRLPPLVLATTHERGSWSGASRQAFRRLAGHQRIMASTRSLTARFALEALDGAESLVHCGEQLTHSLLKGLFIGVLGQIERPGTGMGRRVLTLIVHALDVQRAPWR